MGNSKEKKAEGIISVITCVIIMLSSVGIAEIYHAHTQGKLVAGILGSTVCFGILSILEMENERKQGILYRTQRILEESKIKP